MKRSLLKGLSLILIAALVSSSSGFMSFAQPEPPLSIAVITDVHFNPLSSVPDVGTVRTMPESELYPHALYNAQLYAESEAILARFFENAAESDSPVVLIAGDVVDTARKASHIEFARRLAAFENNTGKRVFVINGNNDIRLNDANCASDANFSEIYAGLGYNEALNRDPSSLSYTVDLDGQYRLLAVDSCKYGESAGVIRPETQQWIREQAQAANNGGKRLVAMMHHALLRHYGGFGDILLDRALDDDRIDNAEDVWEEFADLGIQYVFTGHMHANSITKAVSKSGNPVFDIETNALVNYPCSYRTVTFSDESVDIKTSAIDSIDLSKLQSGYTPQQLSLIESDFSRYAYGYIAVSSKYMLKQYLVYPQNTIDRIGLDKESGLTKLLMELLPDMYDCFAMPLYITDGTDGASIEEIAASGGYILPASSYKDFYDALSVIIGNYTSGDANMPGDSLEVKLLLDCVKAVLVYALGSNAELITPQVIKEITALTGIEFTPKELTSGLATLVFRRSLADRLVKSLLFPFLDGVTKDAFPPGDVNVVLPPYGGGAQAPAGFFVTLMQSMQTFLEKLLKIFAIFISV